MDGQNAKQLAEFLTDIWANYPESDITAVLLFAFQIFIPDHWFSFICLPE